jgi:hypothetical protein
VRSSIAAALAALSAILVVFCWRGRMAGLDILAPMTLAFVGACLGVLAASEDTTVARRRFAIAGITANVVVLVIACALFLTARTP